MSILSERNCLACAKASSPQMMKRVSFRDMVSFEVFPGVPAKIGNFGIVGAGEITQLRVILLCRVYSANGSYTVQASSAGML